MSFPSISGMGGLVSNPAQVLGGALSNMPAQMEAQQELGQKALQPYLAAYRANNALAQNRQFMSALRRTAQMYGVDVEPLLQGQTGSTGSPGAATTPPPQGNPEQAAFRGMIQGVWQNPQTLNNPQFQLALHQAAGRAGVSQQQLYSLVTRSDMNLVRQWEGGGQAGPQGQGAPGRAQPGGAPGAPGQAQGLSPQMEALNAFIGGTPLGPRSISAYPISAQDLSYILQVPSGTGRSALLEGMGYDINSPEAQHIIDAQQILGSAQIDQAVRSFNQLQIGQGIANMGPQAFLDMIQRETPTWLATGQINQADIDNLAHNPQIVTELQQQMETKLENLREARLMSPLKYQRAVDALRSANDAHALATWRQEYLGAEIGHIGIENQVDQQRIQNMQLTAQRDIQSLQINAPTGARALQTRWHQLYTDYMAISRQWQTMSASGGNITPPDDLVQLQLGLARALNRIAEQAQQNGVYLPTISGTTGLGGGTTGLGGGTTGTGGGTTGTGGGTTGTGGGTTGTGGNVDGQTGGSAGTPPWARGMTQGTNNFTGKPVWRDSRGRVWDANHKRVGYAQGQVDSAISRSGQAVG